MATAFTSLPTELWAQIATHLNTEHHQTLSLLNYSFRKLSLPFLFGCLRIVDGGICAKLKGLNEASINIKAIIKTLYVRFKYWSDSETESPEELYDLLSKLPNLRTLSFEQINHLVPPTDIAKLIAALKKAPLQDLKLDLHILKSPALIDSPAEGFAGLERLSVKWELDNAPDDTDRSRYLRPLEALILPSIDTLVDLTIYNVPFRDIGAEDLDLLQLANAGPTLRRFDYTLRSIDDGILDTIPRLFPHLKQLVIRWVPKNKPDSVPWKSSHLQALSRNKNLVELSLSSDFEILSNDIIERNEDFPWLLRCYTRRLEATRALCETLPELCQCEWVQYHAQLHYGPRLTHLHRYMIETKPTSEGQARVVRGFKQWWMGRKHDDVDARLEALPGEVIGENDDDEDEDEYE